MTSPAAARPCLELNREQDLAVAMAADAARRPGTIARLSGPAGTGKTTTLRAIVERLGDVVIVAPTGKAALRAAEATGAPTSTIHRWLYHPVEDAQGEVHFERRSTDAPAPDAVRRPRSGLVVVDESSMVTADVWTDVEESVRELHCSVLLVGDGFQLPPVAAPGEEPFSVFGPDFMPDQSVELVEVLRQAQDSPVLRAATALRGSNWTRAFDVVRRTLPWLEGDLAAHVADLRQTGTDAIVIAHRNVTRMQLNRDVRWDLLGLPANAEPMKGEPLLVRRNSTEVGVFNGQGLDFAGWDGEAFRRRDALLRRTRINRVRCTLCPDAVVGTASEPSRWVALDQKQRGEPLVRAQLGYAVTCHSAQGSEWDEAVVVVEGSLRVMPDEERVRWLYTAITRAKSRVVLARPPAGVR